MVFEEVGGPQDRAGHAAFGHRQFASSSLAMWCSSPFGRFWTSLTSHEAHHLFCVLGGACSRSGSHASNTNAPLVALRSSRACASAAPASECRSTGGSFKVPSASAAHSRAARRSNSARVAT